MELTGSFRGLSANEALQLIRITGKTGILTIDLDDENQQSVRFHKGRITGVEIGGEGLAHILLERDIVTDAAVNEAIEKQHASEQDETLEQILLDSGIVSQEDLAGVLQSEAERLIALLIYEQGGQASFEESSRTEPESGVALDLQGVLAAVSASAGHDAPRFDISSTDVIVRSAAGTRAFGAKSIELWLEDWKVFLAIDGRRNVDQISEKAKMSRDAVIRSIAILAERGLVETA